MRISFHAYCSFSIKSTIVRSSCVNDVIVEEKKRKNCIAIGILCATLCETKKMRQIRKKKNQLIQCFDEIIIAVLRFKTLELAYEWNLSRNDKNLG